MDLFTGVRLLASEGGFDLSTGVQLLVTGGVIAFFGTLLTMRDGRQKRYDERVDNELVQTRKERDDLKSRVENLENAADRFQEESSRLRRMLYDNGINPGPMGGSRE